MTIVLPHSIARAAGAAPAEAFADCPTLPRNGEIFLWLLDLPSLPLTPMLQFVTDAERGADERRLYRSDFEPWLKSRAALRCILSAFTGQAARGTSASRRFSLDTSNHRASSFPSARRKPDLPSHRCLLASPCTG